MDNVLAPAKRAAEAAARVILDMASDPGISAKASNNLVTQADKRAEQVIVDLLKTEFPEHCILAEESSSETDLQAEHLWIIDPLDGTNNYAHGIPHYSVSIGYARHGELTAGVVYDPLRKEMFYAVRGSGAFCNGMPICPSRARSLPECIVATGFHYSRGEYVDQTLSALSRLFTCHIRGVRRTGSAALDLCWTACGRLDAYFEYLLSPWDFAGGACIAAEAGACCYDRYGTPLKTASHGVIVANANLMPLFLETVHWQKGETA